MTKSILIILGTRPEAIKLAPVVHALQTHSDVSTSVCSTGQHTSMLNQTITALDLRPDIVVRSTDHKGNLSSLSGALIADLGEILANRRPDLVIVQGDTTTALCGSIAAEYACIPVAHVEAGLRTFDPRAPWPEEANRKMVSQLATLHFAPTPTNKTNLLAEGIAEKRIAVTGNPVVDALRSVVAHLDDHPEVESQLLQASLRSKPDRFAIATVHRRESHGVPLARLCAGLIETVNNLELELVVPVHPNPAIQPTVERLLGPEKRIQLVAPLDYLTFIALLRRATLVLSDSGGIQEECAALGTPIIVMREKTERPEVLLTGHAWLAGTEGTNLSRLAREAVEQPGKCTPRQVTDCVFGDGFAARRIADLCIDFLNENSSH